MTSLETIRAADATVPAASGLWRAELAQTIRLAVPMALTQLGQVVMMTTDLVLIGRLGDEALAAAALAHTVLFAAFTLGMGLVSAVAPLASQAFGARQPRMVRRALRVGLWAAVILGVPMTLLQFWGEDILVALGPAAAVGCDGRAISDRHGLGAHPGLGVHRLAQLHGRGQPARAGAVDHARRHSGQRRARLRPHLRCVRAAGARSPGRRPRHRADRRRHVRGRRLHRLHAPPVQEVSRARALLAPRLAPLRQARGCGVADLRRVAAGVWAVRRGRAADGPHLHERGRRAPDRAADGGAALHGAVRHRAGRHRARRPRRGSARFAGHAPRRLRRDRPGRRRSWR